MSHKNKSSKANFAKKCGPHQIVNVFLIKFKRSHSFLTVGGTVNISIWRILREIVGVCAAKWCND